MLCIDDGNGRIDGKYVGNTALNISPSGADVDAVNLDEEFFNVFADFLHFYIIILNIEV